MVGNVADVTVKVVSNVAVVDFRDSTVDWGRLAASLFNKHEIELF